MKRRGWIIEQVADMENLRLAFWKAKKGKSLTKEVQDFLRPNLDQRLLSIRDEILQGEYEVGGYHYFKIYEPKERLVSAAPFKQRILHHAIMNVCHNDFDNFQIYDSYASRKGKGVYKALERAMSFQKKYKFCLKLDVRKYFDSIDHLILGQMLEKMYKDIGILELFKKIIESYEVKANKGLPIGNLTSQYFANHYLSLLDRKAKEEWGVKGYVRYMDDIIIWDNSKIRLKEIGNNVKKLLRDKLKLELKVFQIKPCTKNTTFLGYQISSFRLRLSSQSVARYKRHLKDLYYKYNQEEIGQCEMCLRLMPILAFVDKVNAKGIKERALKKCYS